MTEYTVYSPFSLIHIYITIFSMTLCALGSCKLHLVFRQINTEIFFTILSLVSL